MATTSTTITFSTETSVAGASLSVDLDEDRNEGRSRFLYGTKAYFRIFPFPTTLQLTVTPSDGAVSVETGGLAEITELITFANVDEASTRLPIVSVIGTPRWFGNSLGAVTTPGGNVVKVANKGVGVLEIKYRALYVGRSLTLPFRNEEEYPVVVFVLGA